MAAAGSCTVEKAVIKDPLSGSSWGSVFIWNWTSSAGGAVTEVGPIAGISGRIEHVRFIPAADADAPTDAYDVTMLDQYGADVLMGTGANVSNSRSNTAANFRTPLNVDQSYIYLHNATLTPAITNAGNAKKGIIKLIVR